MDDSIMHLGFSFLGLVLFPALQKEQNILQTESVLFSEERVKRHVLIWAQQ
jgi:hypothetical protein